MAIPKRWNAAYLPSASKKLIQCLIVIMGICSNQFVGTDDTRLWAFRIVTQSNAWHKSAGYLLEIGANARDKCDTAHSLFDIFQNLDDGFV